MKDVSGSGAATLIVPPDRNLGDEMEAPMLGLLETFARKCRQLKQAVAGGHDDLVRALDRELEPMIDDILSYRAETREDMLIQLQFLNGLIRDEADDKSSVIRRSAAMSMLFDRYLRNSSTGGDRSSQPALHRTNGSFAFEMPDQPLFNEAVLDSLPDRVGVITRDYRYLYSNQANAQFLSHTTLSMIGCHVSDFIGEESFRTMAKPAFERCFRGDKVDYLHEGRRNSRSFTTRCRMSPLRGASNEIIGAVIVLQKPDKVAAFERN